ncbi:MDR family MFS transporter [Flexivirga caeni]|uniref:DHA2 family efflux MFS transporter permease subunit n=1 Tax=Flexivirga caeni TaxID=2294115 RepID=A0A3M9MFV1_9MICO|nr:MDR family MFS transporter [Flexivirga caeni]RNI24374.1 DHA2 family efflux MFS transporter permease subunit [Flexivirga caeni]
MSLRENQKLVVPVVYVAAMFMAIMDTTIVNVALPTIGRDLHTHPDSVGLVSIAYLVSLAVFIPASGWLGDRIGGRTALLGAVAVFTVASGLCGLATGFEELVAFRVLQGIGGAVMTPVGMAMLFRVYAPAERVRVAGILAIVTALAPALGPILGGLFTSYLSWRLVFFVNLPIGLAAFLVGAFGLDAHRTDCPGRLDIPGLLLSGAGLGSLMYGVSEGPTAGWNSGPVLSAVVAGVVLLVIMVIVELRAAEPLVDLRMLARHRLFAAATSLYALASVSYLGALFLAALTFQNAMGMSAIQSGLTVFPSALGTMAGGQIVTRLLYWRFGPRRLSTAGLLLIALATALMARVGDSTDLWLVRLIMFCLGIGVALVFITNQAASMATIGKAETGRASAIYNAGKQLGGAVGIALLSTVLAAVGSTRISGGRQVPNLTAYHAAFVAAAAVALLSVFVALTTRDSDAAPTMIRPTSQSTSRPPRHTGVDGRSRPGATSGFEHCPPIGEQGVPERTHRVDDGTALGLRHRQ